MSEILPDLPVELPPEPIALLQSSIPGRLIPTLIPRYQTQAARVTFKDLHAGVDCILKYITTYVIGETQINADLYAFMLNGDIDGFLAVSLDSETDEVIFEVTRLAWYAHDVYLDGALKASMPAVTAGDELSLGYLAFRAARE